MTDTEIFVAALVGFGWIGIFFLMAIAVVKAVNKATANRGLGPGIKFTAQFEGEDPIIVKEWPRFTFVVHVSADEDDGEPIWISHCLETDNVSQANSPEEALERSLQSAAIQTEMESREGKDILSHPAPKECWPRNMMGGT